MMKIKQSISPTSPGLISFYDDNNTCIRDCNTEYDKASQAAKEGASSILAIRRIQNEMQAMVLIEHAQQNNKVKQF